MSGGVMAAAMEVSIHVSELPVSRMHCRMSGLCEFNEELIWSVGLTWKGTPLTHSVAVYAWFAACENPKRLSPAVKTDTGWSE